MQKNNNKIDEAYKKTGKPAKDIIPPEVQPFNIRNSIQMKFVDSFENNYKSPFTPNSPFEEWPGDDIALAYDFGVECNTLYTDKSNNFIILPYSLRNETIYNLIWLRPMEYIKYIFLKDKIKLPFNLNTNNTSKSKEIKTPLLERRNTMNYLKNREINNMFEQYPLTEELEQKLQQALHCYIVKTKEVQSKGRGNDNNTNNDTKSIQPLKGRRKSIQRKSIQRKSIQILQQEEIIQTHLEPDPSSIAMNRYYCKYSKWLASIYQCIIDNQIADVNNPKEKSIPMKIYPQKNGVPIYNPSGKYWVKLYHMGKYRKIEIDDQIPLTKQYELLLPQCLDINELWPVLITKALMKLYSYKYRNSSYDKDEVGDCSPFYALTGYLCTDIPSKVLYDDFNQNPTSSLITVILNEDNYKTKNMMIVGYKKEEQSISSSASSFNIQGENCKIENDKKAFEKYSLNNKKDRMMKLPIISENYSHKKLPLAYSISITNNEKNKHHLIQTKNKKMQNGIYYNTVYSLIEIFESKQFNLKCLFPIDFSDLKLDNDKKFKQLFPEEKLIFIENLQSLRKIQRTEKKKRLSEWRLPGQNSLLVKITNQALDYDNRLLSDIMTPYNDIHIEIVKKCLLNNLKYPPVNYFTLTFLDQIYKDEETGEINFWTKRFYLKFFDRENQKEEGEDLKYTTPLKRKEGKWLSYDKLTESFSHFIVLVNPSVYKSKLHIDNIWYNYDKDLFEENDAIKIIRLKGQSDKDKEKDGGIYNKSSLTIIFEPNGERNCKPLSTQLPSTISQQNKHNLFDDIEYSLSIQLYMVKLNAEANQSGFITYKQLSLRNQVSAIEINDLDIKTDYFLNLKGGIIPFGYCLQLYSNHQLMTYSYQQFLCEFKGFAFKKIAVTHLNLEKGKYYLLSRIKVLNKGNESINPQFYTHINGYDNKSLREFIEVFLINMITNEKKRIIEKELFNVPFLKGESYSIEISIVPPYNIQEKSFEYEIITNNKSEILIEGQELVYPTEVKEMFLPNNKGINSEITIASLEIELYCDLQMTREKDEKGNPNTQIEEEAENQSQTKASIDIIKQEKPQNIRMTIEFIEKDRLLFSKSFFNKTILRNLYLRKREINPKANYQESGSYQLNCYLDMTECPSCLYKASEYKSNYFWHIRLFSSDAIYFVQNTIKEDKEREMIKSWETNQLGRGEKAKNARNQFFILKKKQQEESEDNKKPQEVIESSSSMIITNIPPSSNSEFSFNELNLSNKPLPIIENYNSFFMRNFFVYTTSKRIIIQNTRNKSIGLPSISQNNSQTEEEEKKKKRESIIERYNQYYQLKDEEDKSNNEKAKQVELELVSFAERLHMYKVNKNQRIRNMHVIKSDIIDKETELNTQIDILKAYIEQNYNKDSTLDFITVYNQLKHTMSLKQMKDNRNVIIIEAIKLLSQKKEEMILNDIINLEKYQKPKAIEIINQHIMDLNENILQVKQDIYIQLNDIKDKLSN